VEEPIRYKGIVVVIPTRNRPALAKNAIRSVLEQRGCVVEVIVSDNSTSPEDLSELKDFCLQQKDRRLRYITPPRPLPMTRHWDWVLQQALNSHLNHFTFLADRWIFLPGALEAIANIATKEPSKIICYLHDRIDDLAKPVRLRQLEWTGNLFEVTSEHLLSLAANSVIYDSSFPRMLNCVVPRVVFDKVKDRFGSVFESISPDWNFCFRVLSLEDSVIYFDKAMLVHYALARSNGQGMERGVETKDHADFLANLQTRLNAAAPIPEITTVWNAIIHEYCEVKRDTNSSRFPELDMTKYVQALAQGISWMEDPFRRREMETILQSRGSQLLAETGSSTRTITIADTGATGDKLESNIQESTRLRSVTEPSVQSMWLRLGKYFGVRPQGGKRLRFETAEQALDYAIRFPRLPRRNWRAAIPPEELLGSVKLQDLANIRRPEPVSWRLGRFLDRHVLWRLRT
jgi:glycosyltransferase involved in cell wall biosynthesis